MKYKVLTSFAGAISGRKNEELNISNKEIATDLLQAGYIEAVAINEKIVMEEPARKTKATKTTSRKGK